ncbi:MAG: hypothetical protein AAF916_03925 [Planctomycetota bacterium]
MQTFDVPVTQMGEFVVSGSPNLQTDFSADTVFGGGNESRAVMEFLLSGVPAGELIEAQLSYSINALQGNGNTTPSLQFFAYPGDGVAEASDVNNTTLVGTTGQLGSTGAKTQPLDLATMQGLLAGGPEAVGLMAWSQFGDSLRAGIHWNAFPPEDRPSLSLTMDILRQGTLTSVAEVDAEAIQPTYGGPWEVSDGDNSIAVRDAEIINQNSRGILEFDLPQLPMDAIVTGGRLKLDVNSFTSGGGEFPSAAAHLYVGDGAATVADATSLSIPWSSSGPITQTGELVIDLPRSSLEFASDEGLDFLGALLRSDSGNTDFASFATTEFADLLNDPSSAPRLEIDYAILTDAIPGDADLDEDIDLTDALILINSYTGSLNGTGDSIWLNGDFDGDGDVDFRDAMALRNNFAGDTAALDAAFRQIPEPSIAMGLIGLLGVFRRR